MFFSKGKEAGFSLKEIDMLRRLANKNNLSDPASLFWSRNQLDMCIRNFVRSSRLAGGTSQSTQDFLSKLYDYRKKIEMEKPQTKSGISSSRQLEEGQALRILTQGNGVFPSSVVKNTGQYMVIARPNSPKLPLSFSWIGLRISVYFWRDDDAGYVFDTDIQDEVFSRGNPGLKINHAESLVRTQKRRSIRIKTHRPAFLYLLDNDEPSFNMEINPGLKCFVEDLSDTGYSILIGGRAAVGLRIKVQFILNNVPLCISGTVRSMEYHQDVNKSVIRTEADQIPLETRNHILGEVFGMLPDEDDELPFRVLDEEASSEAENVIRDTSAMYDDAL